jgi:hypothetical protein
MDVDRETILRGAHRYVGKRSRDGREPLWYFIEQVCAVGSTSAKNICRELGWNPDAPTRQPLPPRGAAR